MASEEYEVLRKYFIDKEKENIQLKEELNNVKNKMNLNFKLNLKNLDIVNSQEYGAEKNMFSSEDNNNSTFIAEGTPNVLSGGILQLDKNNLTTFRRESSTKVSPSESQNIQEHLRKPNTRSKSEIVLLSSITNLPSRNHPIPEGDDGLEGAFNSQLTPTKTQDKQIYLQTDNNQQINKPFLNHLQLLGGGSKENKNICFDLGKTYDEKSKSSMNLNIIGKLSTDHLLNTNKTVIKNIGNNIVDLKTQLNNYEKAYETITSRLEKSPEKGKSNLNNNRDINQNNQNNQNNANNHNNTVKINSKVDVMKYDMIENSQNSSARETPKNDFNYPQNLQQLKQIKDYYDNELKHREDLYSQNISHLNQSHQEEVKHMRMGYEGKIERIIKKSEDEKADAIREINMLKNELKMSTSRIKEDKNDTLQFQRKYIEEMKELHSRFEEFRNKTAEEFHQIRRERDAALNDANIYKDSFEKLKEEFDLQENMYKENNENLKTKQESLKMLTKSNELLKNQLELSKSEVNFLKMKINKLESSEKSLHNILTEKENLQNLQSGLPSTRNNLNYQQADLVNYELFSPVKKPLDSVVINNGNYRQVTQGVTNNYQKQQNHFPTGNYLNSNYHTPIEANYTSNNSNVNGNMMIMTNYDSGNITNEDSQVGSNKIDMRNALQKIRQMEDCLKSMNEENENLRGKLGNVVNLFSTPNMTQGSDVGSGSSYNNRINQHQQKNINANNITSSSQRFRDLTPQLQIKSSPTRTFNNNHNYTNHKPTYNRFKNTSMLREEYTETIETMEDNVIEFPLQVKIKGKIKNISTSFQKLDS
jgi:hypothetical protein